MHGPRRTGKEGECRNVAEITHTTCLVKRHSCQVQSRSALLLRHLLLNRGIRMPSQLEGAMDALISVFYNYSGHDGDKYKLNKGELKQLLHTELTDFLTSQKDPLLVEKIMSDLDSNKDNEVDFNEFVVLVAALTVACNDFFQEQKKKNPK
ncbi:protein S100-Z isoform X2 [Corythoichthys intestinalis]|uniref:protein S100-Z isoform X2 n=1 Tax=Corythoichthys intestinalis TaxID=161448 RepID=UPI0025A5BE30|nr:protein S100-Z isoform X2 [Corythoichthys intestinalis]